MAALQRSNCFRVPSSGLRIGGRVEENRAELLQALTAAVRLEEFTLAAIETLDASEVDHYVGEGYDPFFLDLEWIRRC